MNKFKQLQEKLERMKELLAKLERTKKSESCDYQLVLDEDGINSQYYGFKRFDFWSFDDRIKLMYALVEIKTGKVLVAGFKRRIIQFTRLRSISKDKILDADLFQLTEEQYFQRLILDHQQTIKAQI